MQRSFGIILYFFSLLSYGQNYSFENITTSEGLSNNTILCIDQDHYGRIWLATYDGLTIYDGTEFKIIRYNPQFNRTGFPKGKTKQLIVDKDGTLWVIFENNKLIRLLDDNGNCKHYDCIDSLKNTFKLTNGANGDLFVHSKNTYYKYYKNKDVFLKINPNKKELEFITLRDNKNKEIRRKLLQTIPDAKIFDIFIDEDKKKTLVCTINKGVFYYNSQNNKVINFNANQHSKHNISSNEVYCSFIDNENNIWIGTKDGGISLYRDKGEIFNSIKNYKTDTIPFSTGTIRAINKDNKERIWLGTYNNGIIVLDKNEEKQIQFSKNENNKWNWIRSIHKSSDGNMWIGSYAGLCKVNPNNLKITYYNTGNNKKSIHTPRIYSIAEDRKGNIYIGEWGGIDYYNKDTGEFLQLDSLLGLSKKKIRKLYLDKKGNLWVGTEASGVFEFDTRNYNLINHYTEGESNGHSLSSNSIFEICEDSKENIWIGTFGGINKINNTGKVDQMLSLNSELPSTLVYKMFWDKNGSLWFDTPNCIAKFDPIKSFVRTYDANDGFELNDFAEGAGYQDSNGHIYFGGCDGYISFNTNNITKNKTTPKVHLSQFTLNHDENIDIALDSVYNLPSLSNHLKFKINSILINGRNKTKIAWKLEPYEKEFRLINGSSANIEYSNLAPGNYTLKIKSSNPDGYWSKENKVISFIIPKPFWSNAYFYLACFTILTIIILVFIRFRFKQIEKRNKQLEDQIKQRTRKIENQKFALEQAYKSLELKNSKVLAQRDQILAQHAHLFEMHSKLEESNVLKQKFFTNVSHDIRTPLTLIAGPLSELINDKTLQSEHRDKLERMQRNVNYILQLLNQVLDKKKLEVGGLKKIMTQGDVVSVCQQVINSFKDQASINNQTLILNCTHESYHIRFDHDKLQQIVYNLLANAIKFTPANGKIECTLNLKNDEVNITIADNGIGIPEDRIEHIFDRYYQVGKSNKTNEGNGIGLSMVKEFVELLDGKINVTSKEGEGSYFSIIFPIVEPKENGYINDISSNNNETITSNNNDCKNSILIVEDNVELKEYLIQLLSQKYNVVAVENGIEAIKHLNKNTTYDIIISDWMMSEMDGITLCKTVKKKDSLKSIPFIMLTALDQIENQKEGYMAGVDEYIAKPFEPELLFLKVDNLINRNKLVKHSLKVEEIIKPKNKKETTFDEILVEKISNVINNEMSNPDFNQQVLGDKLGLSQMQLYRKVKEHMQTTPNELIRSVRIKRAKQLLQQEGFTINEVSYKVGFNDSKYFSRCFTKETGICPSLYKKQQLESDRTV